MRVAVAGTGHTKFGRDDREIGEMMRDACTQALAEVHDCLTIAELIEVEDLGFCAKGEGGKLIDEGQTEIGGSIPVNTSGGLKAKGHPVGATGISQVVEIVKQLRGEAGKRQVPGAKRGLCCNIGGLGATAVVFYALCRDGAYYR